jgi:hypothetical protein
MDCTENQVQENRSSHGRITAWCVCRQIGRNTLRAGNVVDFDTSIIKCFSLGSDRLGVRIDIFNFLNRTNYGIPVRILEAPGFGKAVNTVTPGRRVQFSVKYEF